MATPFPAVAGEPRSDARTGQFRRRVLAVVRRIPPGRVASYGDVARLAGYPRAARAVGTVMRTCRAPGVPCHRVIAADGRLAGFAGMPELKRALLAAEGLVVRGMRVRRLAVVRWPCPGQPARPGH